MRRGRPPTIDAARTRALGAALERILDQGYELVHTRQLGWMLRQWDSWEGRMGEPHDGWHEVDCAPEGELGELLLRQERRLRSQRASGGL